MKKILYSASLAIVSAFALVSCQLSESIAPEQIDDCLDSVEASLPVTRTTNDGMKTLWKANDGIVVFHALSGTTNYVKDKVFRITTGEVTSGEFTGTFAEELNPSANYDWYAFHPVIGITSPNGTGATNAVGANIQTQATANSSANLCGTACPLYGKISALPGSESPSFSMRHIAAAAKINVKNTTGDYVRIHSLEIIAPENISGPQTIDFSGDQLVFSSETALNNVRLHVAMDAVLINSATASYYLSFKPFTVPAGSELVVRVNGYEKKIVATEPIEFKSGYIKEINFTYDLPAKDFSGEYFLTAVGGDGNTYAASGIFSQCGLYDGSPNTNTVYFGHYIRFDGDQAYYDDDMSLAVKESIDDYKFIVEKVTEFPYTGMYTIKTSDGMYMATTSPTVNSVASQSNLDSNCYWDISDCGTDNTYIVATISENHRRLIFNYNGGNYPRYTCFDETRADFVLPKLKPFGTPSLDPIPRLSVSDIEALALPVADDTLVIKLTNNHLGWVLGVSSFTGCVSNAWAEGGTIHYSLSENLDIANYAYGTIVISLTDPTSTYPEITATVNVTQGRSKKVDPSSMPVIKIGGCGALDAGNHMTYLPGIDYNFDAIDYNDNNNVSTGGGAGRMYTEDDFDYEIFAKIEAGNAWYFYIGDEDAPTTVLVPNADGNALVETTLAEVATTAVPVKVTSVYRARYSSITKEFIIQRVGNDAHVDGATFREWIAGEASNLTQDLTYCGNGVWVNESLVPARARQRGYKFLLFGLPQDQPYGFMNRGAEGFVTFDLSGDLPAFPGDFWKVCSVKGGGACIDINAATPRNGTWPVFTSVFTTATWKVYLWMNDTYGAYMHYVGPDTQSIVPEK